LLAICGTAELVWAANPLSAAIGVLTLAAYRFVFTPLKRYSPVSTTVAAFAGVMPPLIGYAAEKWKPDRGSMGARRDSFRVAVSALACNRVDLTRRLCAGWHTDVAGHSARWEIDHPAHRRICVHVDSGQPLFRPAGMPSF
jgi:hypothetical protein